MKLTFPSIVGLLAVATAVADPAATAPTSRPAATPVTTAPTATPAATAPGTAPADDTLIIKTGDVVVFIGDELSEVSAARRTMEMVYPSLVETFLTARYPELRARYICTGWSGDTVQRVLLRLDRDVLVLRPTVAVICLGLNDPGYLGFDEKRLESFRQDLAKLVQRCREAGARTWLLSPPSVEEEKGRKVRVTREDRPAVVDLQAIHYNETLARYAAAVKDTAAATHSGFVDWFEASTAARAEDQRRTGSYAFTRDGRIPQARSTALAATRLLQAWRAEPIRVMIDLDWQQGTVRVLIGNVPRDPQPVQMTEDGQRMVELRNLPLPWPMPGGPMGSLQEGWEAETLCQFVFKMGRPPPRGIVLMQEVTERGTTRQVSIPAAQLQAGYNLATAEPLRSLKGVRELANLIGTKNGTRQTVWQRLELSPPREPELAEAHRKLIDAWKSYVAGYEEMVFKYPKTFDATFVLTEAVEAEHLPTSRPVGTRPARIGTPGSE